MDLATRLEAYRKDGYTIFEAAYDEDQMVRWRALSDRLIEEHTGIHQQRNNWWFGNMLERAPQLMWPVVSNAEILEFAEQVVGPFVQLDNLTLAAFPSMDAEKASGRVSGWHRDRWSRVPQGHYERPSAFNAICYLQDLTDGFGPLRIIPGSHLHPVTLEPETGQQPREDEVLVPMKAGDVIVTHNGLLHSGTPNTSGHKRYFFSVYYNTTWLKHTDTYEGPNCRQLKEWARRRNDHRSLRLLGVDDHLEARANSGFVVADETRWQSWQQQDRDAITESNTKN